MKTSPRLVAFALATLCAPCAAALPDAGPATGGEPSANANAAATAAASAPTPTALVWRADDPALSWGPCPPFLPEGCGIAVLHGDPSAPNADVFFRVPAGARIARHWHNSAERIVVVAGEMEVTYDGHASSMLQPGSYAYGPARLPHSAVCVGKTACVLAIAFEQPVDAIEGEPAD